MKAEILDKGAARLVWRDFPLDRLALTAAAVARSLPAERYEGFIGTLLANQDRWAFGRGETMNALAGMAALAGMSRTKSTRWWPMRRWPAASWSSGRWRSASSTSRRRPAFPSRPPAGRRATSPAVSPSSASRRWSRRRSGLERNAARSVGRADTGRIDTRRVAPAGTATAGLKAAEPDQAEPAPEERRLGMRRAASHRARPWPGCASPASNPSPRRQRSRYCPA
ncbi:hypothetical protein ACFQU2_27600 [Siccirubricoccus deserti]